MIMMRHTFGVYPGLPPWDCRHSSILISFPLANAPDRLIMVPMPDCRMDVHPDRIAHGINPAFRIPNPQSKVIELEHRVTLLNDREIVDGHHNPDGRFRNV